MNFLERAFGIRCPEDGKLKASLASVGSFAGISGITVAATKQQVAGRLLNKVSSPKPVTACFAQRRNKSTGGMLIEQAKTQLTKLFREFFGKVHCLQSSDICDRKTNSSQDTN